MRRCIARFLDGEELYFINQGTSTFEHHHLPWSEFGIAYQRFEGTSFEVKLRNDWWGANEWARYPDIYDNYKKWIALRNETWSEEMNTLEVRMLKCHILRKLNFRKPTQRLLKLENV